MANLQDFGISSQEGLRCKCNGTNEYHVGNMFGLCLCKVHSTCLRYLKSPKAHWLFSVTMTAGKVRLDMPCKFCASSEVSNFGICSAGSASFALTSASNKDWWFVRSQVVCRFRTKIQSWRPKTVSVWTLTHPLQNDPYTWNSGSLGPQKCLRTSA